MSEQNNITTTNMVSVTGRCISVRDYRKNMKLVTLFCKGDDGHDVYPQFVCKDPQFVCKEFPDDLIRRQLTITGHIQNFPLKTESGEIAYRQRFVADTVQRSQTLTEEVFGIKGKFVSPHYTEVCLKGRVQAVKSDGQWTRFIVDVGTDKKRIPVKVSMKNASRPFVVKQGSVVCCVCRVATPEKIKEGKKIPYENLIVDDIALAE